MKHWVSWATAIAGGWLGLGGGLSEIRLGAATEILYDGARPSLPSEQGWTYLAEPLEGALANQTLGEGVTLLDTSKAMSDKAGWFSHLGPLARHPHQPPLDAREGFLVSFVVRVEDEVHARTSRAGFSVIVLARDRSGIELGFWSDEVWAQSGADFRHAEGAAVDTSATRTRYDLEVAGERYRLSAAGAVLLEGPLRHYAAAGLPYNLPEFIFLGDDTTSASAKVELALVAAGPLPKLTLAREPAGLRLRMEVESGREVVFEASADAGTWTVLGTSVSEGGTAEWVVDSTGDRRWFRAFLR